MMGLTAGDGGLVAWPMAVGMTIAKRHLLSGDALSGQRAYDLGAVTDLAADRNGVASLANEIAARMASLPPMAVQLTKRGFNKLQDARIGDGFDLGVYLEAMSLGTEDILEAVDAFLEKRAPEWTGQYVSATHRREGCAPRCRLLDLDERPGSRHRLDADGRDRRRSWSSGATSRRLRTMQPAAVGALGRS